MYKNPSSHLTAVLQALFVTFLWSTSWVLIKFGLKDVPAITFAGLRYIVAFLALLPFVLRPAHIAAIRALSGREWSWLIGFGVLFVAVTQGAQYLGLAYLPAVTVSLLLNFTPVVVALMGIGLLSERPTALQWAGVGLYVLGVLVYFYPILIPQNQALGIAIVLVGVLTNAASSIIGRRINRDKRLHPLVVTVVSMGVGAFLLLGSGIAFQGLPALSATNWVYILWLAIVNTAFTFPLWNHTLRTLSAVESSIINSTMMVQIAALAWLFLGERISWQEAAGLALVVVGTLVVQLRMRAQAKAVRQNGELESVAYQAAEVQSSRQL